MIGVEKAAVRLKDAKSAFDSVKASKNYDQFREAWFKFLTACNGIDAILETSSRNHPTSRQWYGKKRKIRTKDPLLSYLHQARNVEEHGIQPVATHELGGLTLSSGGGSGFIEAMEFGPGFLKMELGDWHGPRPNLVFVPPHARLVDVADERFGTIFKVPFEHLGQPIEDQSPATVGKLWLSYCEALVEEARKLAT